MEEIIENLYDELNINTDIGDILLDLLYFSEQLQVNISDIQIIIPYLEESSHQRRENIELDIEYIKYNEDVMKLDPCSICFENFTKDSMVCNISCKHIFHKECISEWGKWQQNCPFCKKLLPVTP